MRQMEDPTAFASRQQWHRGITILPSMSSGSPEERSKEDQLLEENIPGLTWLDEYIESGWPGAEGIRPSAATQNLAQHPMQDHFFHLAG